MNPGLKEQVQVLLSRKKKRAILKDLRRKKHRAEIGTGILKSFMGVRLSTYKKRVRSQE